MLLWGHTVWVVAILVITQKVDHPGIMQTDYCVNFWRNTGWLWALLEWGYSWHFMV